jgi:phage terminase large subunit-like protein
MGELEQLPYEWEFWGRPEQHAPPGDWFIWLVLAGRGWGKTRTGAEWVIEQIKAGYERVNLASRTSNDIRKTMIFGESGIIAKAPPDLKPRYVVSLKELQWPDGRVSNCYSADEPDQARGANSEKVWADEVGAWPEDSNPDNNLWTHLKLGCRIGDRPQLLVTTTGKRRKVLRELLKDPACVVTRGHTTDNRANLHATFIQQMLRDYDGTTLGAQELGGDVLEDIDGALWRSEDIRHVREAPCRLVRTVIGIDPAVTNNRRSDAVGIVVVGLGEDDRLYVLADLSDKMGPAEWADRALRAYKDFSVDLIVAETNRGGELIEHTLREAAQKDGWLPRVRTHNSQEDKSVRAEPVSVRYQKGRVLHVGEHRWLEHEMLEWDPAETGGKSPNRIDALVFACTELAPNLGPGNFESVQVEPKPDLLRPDRQRQIWTPERGGRSIWR